MCTANAKNGLAIESQPAQETTSQAPAHRPSRGPYEDHAVLIAQIPDLDQNVASTVLGKPVHAHFISQARSFHLVCGIGLGLLVGTTLPFLFGKASRPNTAVTEPPAWSNNVGSTGINGATLQTTTSTLPSPMSAPTAAAVLLQTPTVQYHNSDAGCDDHRGNPVETVAVRPDMSDDFSSSYPPVADMGIAQRPSGAPAPTSACPSLQILQPGVASECTITTPPVRTNYDRAGASTH